MSPRKELSTRQPFKRTELHSDSKTVRYELVTLVSLEHELTRPNVQDNVTLSNAAIESFAVHYRGLLLFLYGHLDEITANGSTERFSLRPSDVLGWDFYHGWATDCPVPSELIVRSKYRADKHVAHIVTDRREVNQAGSTTKSLWNLSAIASEICAVFSTFLTKAPPTNFDPAELERMMDLLEKRASIVVVPQARSVSAPQPLAKITGVAQFAHGCTSSHATPFELW